MILNQTICGVQIDNFKSPPTPRELGAVIASMPFEAQAEFLWRWQGSLRDSHKGRGHAYQLTRIAEAGRAWDEELGDGYVAGFVSDLAAAIGNTLPGELA